MAIRTSQEIQQAIDQQTGRIQDRLSVIRRDVTSVGSPVRNAISRHPARALALAVGAGVTLGVLLGQTRRSKSIQEDPNEGSEPFIRPRRTRQRKLIRTVLPILLDYGLKYLTRRRS